MPLLDHLIELRNRLLYCCASILAAFVVCYFFAQELYLFLAQPLADILVSEGPEGPEGRRMIFTGLTEAFFTYVKIALWTAFFLSFPLLMIQIWLFVAPGLYVQEKKAFLPFFIATPVLFFMGGALVYYVVFPIAWRFFLGFETSGLDATLPIQLEARVSEYLDLVMTLIFAFGLAFQLPVLLTLLVRAGLVSAQSLALQRKYAIVIAFMAAAILTPPDVISQIFLGLPIVVLYEISVQIAKLIEKKRHNTS